MSIREFARDELTRAGLFDASSDYGGMMGEAIMKMIEVFAEEDHSDFSAGMAVSLFQRLASWEPLTPLTGEDDEWMEVGDGYYQNRRCSHVFKRNGAAYDIEGRVFRKPNGACFTSSDSRIPVTFPYTPKREYVDVSGTSEGD
jgi:hypothetical protein